MAVQVLRTLDFNNATKITNLPDGVALQDAATVAQLNALTAGIAWKDSVRVASTANVTVSNPGTAIFDGITLVSGDRILLKNQTAPAENGIFVFNSSATALTRALDAATANSLESAITSVEEGTTNANTSWRQSSVNFTLGTGAINWASFGVGAGAASTASAGIVQLATQALTDAGSDALQAITPATLAGSVFAAKKFSANVGDGTSSSYTITHNLGTKNVKVNLYRNSGNFDEVLAEVQHTSTTVVTLVFDTAVASNAFTVFIET